MISDDFKNNGASYLLSEDDYTQWVSGEDVIGRPDGQFVTPSNEMDEMLEEAKGDPRIMEEKLGLEPNSLGDNPYRVDIYNPEEYNLRESNSSMSGANENYIKGGKTSGNMSEGVIDQFPNPENNPEVGKVSSVKSSEETETPQTPTQPRTEPQSTPAGKISQSIAAKNPDNTAEAETGQAQDKDEGQEL